MTSIAPANAYRFPIAILEPDIDFLGHVNNASYLRWVQAAVLDHWHYFAPAAVVQAYRWVALRHEIDYLRPAFIGDPMAANVMLERVHGARAYYETTICRGDDLIVAVKSIWCSVDVATLRAVRLDRDTVNHFIERVVNRADAGRPAIAS